MMASPALPAQAPFVLSIDLGTSSLRAMLFDAAGRLVEGTRSVRSYTPRLSEGGGAELDAEVMFKHLVSAVDETTERATGLPIAAVATSSLASNVLSIDEEERPLTPAFLYSDTRAAQAVQELKARFDWQPIYNRTGCPLHSAYLPALLWWLREKWPDEVARAARWVSLHEFFLTRLFGKSLISHSLASWTGLYNRISHEWDGELLNLLGIRREQLSPLAAPNESLSGLGPEFRARWQALSKAPFFPAVGDGAAANLGSGCSEPGTVAITVGTSGAMRTVLPHSATFDIPRGLWLYTIDERRALMGGSLNNGGNVFAFFRSLLQLPEPSRLEGQLQAMEPDGHGLTLLPFFAGERSPGYRGGARAVIAGLSLSSSSVDLVRAALEAIAYRFASIYDLLRPVIPAPREIVASGAALAQSRVWPQILADVLGEEITVTGEKEPTARGAALLALEAIGDKRDDSERPALFAQKHSPVQSHYQKYLNAIGRQKHLYTLLLDGGESNADHARGIWL